MCTLAILDAGENFSQPFSNIFFGAKLKIPWPFFSL